jgi:ADP-dependent NAD(P)H-hydrate dehydratase / NAD(P)H-hydrate epimerase
MKITSAEEMRTIDRVTSERFGVASLSLMEQAGSAVANFAMERWPKAERIVVVCGKGNNGGDGFVAARKLAEAEKRVRVILLAARHEVTGDAAQMLGRLEVPVKSGASAMELAAVLQQADLIIDAILGTGFRPPVSGVYADAILAIRTAAAPVLAVDIPSGADADALAPAGDDALVCRADAVVTFTAPRPAHIFGQLTRGPLRVAPIGSPDAAIQSQLALDLITARDITPLLAARVLDGHKGLYGHVLVVGGSTGKTGAAGMAGLSALRAGAGLVTVATPKSSLPLVASVAPELMTEPLAETDAGSIAAEANLQAALAAKTVIALGPGISRDPNTLEFVRSLVRDCKLPLVLDADGLNAFENRASELDGSLRPLVLTPHPGEMSRLLNVSTQIVQQNRVQIARDFARQRRCVLVLKGHRTLVASADGHVWVNPTGNPGMATGGSGDILTGIVAGTIAQHPSDVTLAVAAAAYLHGLAGDLARDRMGERSLIATDILAHLPAAFRRARELAQLPYVEF